MSKKKAPKVKGFEVPEWVVTFGDMISLLVTFFILLMTYSTMEVEQYSKMAGSLAGAFGVVAPPDQPDDDALSDPPPTIQNRVPRDGLRSSRQDLDRIQETAETLVRKPGVGNHVDLERTAQGLRVRIRTETTFRSGSAWLLPETVHILKEVGDLIRIHSHRVTVVGHAHEEGDGFHGEEAEMSLSRDRAVNVAEWLVRSGGVEEDRISVSARGAQAPLDAGGTSQQRRIEILFKPD